MHWFEGDLTSLCIVLISTIEFYVKRENKKYQQITFFSLANNHCYILTIMPTKTFYTLYHTLQALDLTSPNPSMITKTIKTPISVNWHKFDKTGYHNK